MPSQAFKTYRYNVVDVERLFESHKALGGTTQGKKGLGHITKSTIVMLCASWEMYIEQLLVESVESLVEECVSPEELPLSVQKALSKFVKESKHELKVLALAGEGWRRMLVDMARVEADKLNTPKSGVLDPIFLRFLGLEDLSSAWSVGASDINDFVRIRGDIAHRGRHADYPSIVKVRTYAAEIWTTAADCDNLVAQHLKEVGSCGRKPWRQTL